MANFCLLEGEEIISSSESESETPSFNILLKDEVFVMASSCLTFLTGDVAGLKARVGLKLRVGFAAATGLAGNDLGELFLTLWLVLADVEETAEALPGEGRATALTLFNLFSPSSSSSARCNRSAMLSRSMMACSHFSTRPAFSAFHFFFS